MKLYAIVAFLGFLQASEQRFIPDPIHVRGRRFVPYIAQLLVLIKHCMSDLFNHYLYNVRTAPENYFLRSRAGIASP